MTAAAGPGEGPVNRYLDEMFDLLAGTGADGRRLLIEAEEHLTEATAEGRARGLDAEAAEREAVDRFGTAAAVARRVPRAGIVSVPLRRLAIWAWALAGVSLAWYGSSGVLTWLLSWPWTRLLVATDWFGEHPMCEYPTLWPDTADCVRVYQQEISLLPGAGNDFPYLVTAGAGVTLVVALLVLRRRTALGAPSWTPSRRALALTVAVLSGLTGAVLLVEAVDGVFKNVQYYVLAHSVAGLLATVIAAVALRQTIQLKSPSTTR